MIYSPDHKRHRELEAQLDDMNRDYLAACDRGDFSEAADLKEAMADVRHAIFLTGCTPDYEL